MASISVAPVSRPQTLQPTLLIDPLDIVKPTQPISHPLKPQPELQKGNTIGLENTNVDHVLSVDPKAKPLVAVLGCGYVGEHLIQAFQRHYDVIGFDVSPNRIASLSKEYDKKGGRVAFTLNPEDLSKATHFLISVPTLLLEDKTIDTSYIQSALATITNHARQGSTIVVESSVAVGMTRHLAGPLAKERGYYAGMSPERVDPGRTEPPAHAIPKIISGLDDMAPGSLAAISRLYAPVFETLVPVSRPEVAEMMKLYENCQRMMCIAYANEMADACIPHGIDPFEVCQAAATKPFGYMPYTPSLGVGGHCIPVNPYYLLSTCNFPLLQACTEKMWQRPVEIGHRTLETLFNSQHESARFRPAIQHIDSGIDISFDEADEKFLAFNEISRRSSLSSASTCASRARVLVVGVGFKAGQSVLSNSPGQKLVQFLADSGRVDVMFADPLVKQSAIPLIPRLDDDSWNKKMLETFDMIIVVAKQVGLNFDVLQELDGPKIELWCA